MSECPESEIIFGFNMNDSIKFMFFKILRKVGKRQKATTTRFPMF